MLAAGLLVGFVVAELGLRLILPSKLTQGGFQMNFAAGTLKSFVADDECGYLPKTNSDEYNEYGCLRNRYSIQKPAGKKRILFLGDSVTHRSRIILALAHLYGETGYEYWNAGVESFNTEQELVLYRRYNAKIKPDQVILSFHNNDFMQTPLVFQKDGNLQMLTPLRDRKRINMWWFSNSYFYRFLIGLSWRGDSEEKAVEVRRTLLEMKQLMADQKVDFRVVLLPLMKPHKDWDAGEDWSRQQSIEMFKSLQIRYYDLLPRLEEMLARGVTAEEQAGDSWHPNDAAAAEFAEELKKQNLLLGD
jgi:lysophospholipase L1-like esterase